jgi:uncharacterized caspase-like protein
MADYSTFVRWDELTRNADLIRAKHVLFVMDACYGGLLGVRSGAISANVSNYLDEITKRSARQILTAGGPNQQVVDGGQGRHSVFTGYLLKGLEGEADLNGDGYVTFAELTSYLIPAATNAYQTPGYSTLPGHEMGEFVFKSPRPPAKPVRKAMIPAPTERRVPAEQAPNPVLTQVQHRRALVIGNAAYLNGPLLHPVNDATAMAVTLRSVGYEVTSLHDANKPRMEQAVEDFTRGAPSRSVGLFFFSGYGAQINGVNYLLPVGGTFNKESDVQSGAVVADRVLARMSESRMEVKIFILDACRSAPFMRQWRNPTRGLAPMEAMVGAIVAFATAPESVVADGSGKNSVYTENLLRNITEPGLRIEDVFKRTRFGVRQETGGRQVPWENTSLEGDFYVVR